MELEMKVLCNEYPIIIQTVILEINTSRLGDAISVPYDNIV